MLGFAFVRWGYDFPYEEDPGADATVELDDVLRENVVEPKDSLFNELIRTFWLDYDWESLAVHYFSDIINYFLSVASFFALMMMIYWFYLMFFNTKEDAVEKAKKIMKWVVITFFIIWLSWFMVSWFFNIFAQVKW